MIALLADENMDKRLVLLVRRRHPEIDMVRIQETPVFNAGDQEIPAWCAENCRVLLTRDCATIPDHVRVRVLAGLPVTGALIVTRALRFSAMADEIALAATCTTLGDFAGCVIHLPLS